MDPNVYWVAPLVVVFAFLAVAAILRQLSRERAREAADLPPPKPSRSQRIVRMAMMAAFFLALALTLDWRAWRFEIPRAFGPEARPGEGLLLGLFLLGLAAVAFRIFCWSRVEAVAKRRFPRAPLPPARSLDLARLREKEKIFDSWMDGAEAHGALDLRRWYLLYGAATRILIALFVAIGATALFVFLPR